MATDDETTGAARVTRTGIALVHEGEVILPSAGSEAEAELVADDARTVVHYHFPVHIEVSTAPDAVLARDIVDEALRGLARGLANS